MLTEKETKVIGDRIKLLRVMRGVSAADFGESIGVSHPAISRWERHVTFPSSYDIMKICKVYEVSADYIFGFTGLAAVNKV